MPDDDIDKGIEKAIVFFDRAEEVASTDNFDYAIDMYIEGLKRAPDALESGHAPLRRLALIRQGKGGKKASMVEKMKRHGNKQPLDEMLSAEYLLAKDPDHLPYAEAMLRSAVSGGFHRTAEWIARLIYDANRASERPSFSTYLLLKDSYAEMEMYSEAVRTCNHVLGMRPDNAALQDELRDLSAHLTMQKGKYDEDGGFQKSIKDKAGQDQLHSQQRLIKTADFRQKAVDDAKKAVLKDPKSVVNVLELADALCALNTLEDYKSAINLLQDAYKRSNDFSFKRRQGELTIKKLRVDVSHAKAEAKADVSNGHLKNQLMLAVDKLCKAEKEHYKQCVDQYPMDFGMKYEYALCLIKAKEYDAAIPLLQQAQRDPRRKLAAMDETGLCFFLKGWYSDAIDVFSRALHACEVKDGDVAKDLRYNLARSFEEDGQGEKALEMYRKLAQLDFGYKDVKDRVNKMRNAAESSR
ncbi:MAG: hypothetical protein FVQ79_10530 [Planctomycetes bacterium]|nr:hypothetical protein [Planctomycetota bacterium]